ncbi:phage virion morphogenesis protein [Pasteurella multocida]|uniref:phage virion morphogenesis protein n=1 Tax=Pasteurella multocida TaxID=747 RepID=UPI0027BA2EF8|nr:phage virion morphogenesis protein [Pasteurella multocida]WLY63995.1 phage virion morphogenesis protein [Pasteurella multocida]
MLNAKRKIAGVLRSEAEFAFEREQTPEGEGWKPLNEDYRLRRFKQGYTGNKLQKTGKLVASVTIDYGDNFVVIGAAEPYGQYHQLGTTHMTARSFLGLGQNGVDEIVDILQREIKNALETA